MSRPEYVEAFCTTAVFKLERRILRWFAAMANDVRAEAAFPHRVRFVLGETGVPWKWEYGDLAFWDGGCAA